LIPSKPSTLGHLEPVVRDERVITIRSNPAHARHAGIIALGGIGIERNHETREWFAIHQRRLAADGHLPGTATTEPGPRSTDTDRYQHMQARNGLGFVLPHSIATSRNPAPFRRTGGTRNTKSWWRCRR